MRRWLIGIKTPEGVVRFTVGQDVLDSCSEDTTLLWSGENGQDARLFVQIREVEPAGVLSTGVSS